MPTPIDVRRLSWELDRRGLTYPDLAARGVPMSTLMELRKGRPVQRKTLLRIIAVLAEVPPLEWASEILAAPGGAPGAV